jgi:hypothetical protein
MSPDNGLPTGIGFPTNGSIGNASRFATQVRFRPITSHAMQGAGVVVFVNVMRIPCLGRRMTIGRASIDWPGAN